MWMRWQPCGITGALRLQFNIHVPEQVLEAPPLER